VRANEITGGGQKIIGTNQTCHSRIADYADEG
jgi:hypothetical protein